jgi:hypothetical protein
MSLLALAATGCATPQTAGVCGRLQSSRGFDAIDRYTGELVRLGNALHGQWQVCGNDLTRLQAFQADIHSRNLQVNQAAQGSGGCALIPVALKPAGSEVRQASDLICRVAAAHRMTFVSWGGQVGDRYIRITPRDWSDEMVGGRAFRSS